MSEIQVRLKVNRKKSAADRPWDRKYLGFCMTNSRKAPKIRIHWKTIKRLKERVREITARRRGRSINQVINEFLSTTNQFFNIFFPNYISHNLLLKNITLQFTRAQGGM
jgi:hypothetical protein